MCDFLSMIQSYKWGKNHRLYITSPRINKTKRTRKKKVLNKNSYFLKFKQINSLINRNEVLLRVTSHNVKFYKYCSVTSVDVERTFLSLKYNDNQR